MMALRRMIKARNESSFRVRGSNFRHVIYHHNRDLKDTSNERTTLRRRYSAGFIFIRVIAPPTSTQRRPLVVLWSIIDIRARRYAPTGFTMAGSSREKRRDHS